MWRQRRPRCGTRRTERLAYFRARPVEIEAFQISGEGVAERKNWAQIYLVSMVFVMLMYFTIAMYGTRTNLFPIKYEMGEPL